MKCYQVKSTLKGSKPVIWYRTLIPSGITFSQLYYLLTYVHEEWWPSRAFWFETRDRDFTIYEFYADEKARNYEDTYDAAGTYIDTFFRKDFKISLYTGREFDLSILIEEDAKEYSDLKAPKIIKVSRAIAEIEEGQPGEETLPLEMFRAVPSEEHHFRTFGEMYCNEDVKPIMYVMTDPVTPEESICRGKKYRDNERMLELIEHAQNAENNPKEFLRELLSLVFDEDRADLMIRILGAEETEEQLGVEFQRIFEKEANK